ncbi:unnamed protein product [Allacma fusca]|uniref:Uncharacterized protein n=1 Tax=Allacma fusca TaxID=39272 RepID=A0A8J2P7X1_9HEXA|nr:unnamed protein product [Allacma fusca]
MWKICSMLDTNENAQPLIIDYEGNALSVFIPNVKPVEDSATSTNSVSNVEQVVKRNRKRKRFFDDDDELINVKKILLRHDKDMGVTFGSDIIKTSDSLKPLQPKLRRHLIKILCQELVRKSHSVMPSTDQRDQLAMCIVSQLYPTFTGKQYKDLKESFYSPSTTILDKVTGKKRSISPTGHIQYHFKNFWSFIRQTNGSAKLTQNADPIVEENFENVELKSDVMDMKNWLLNHVAPPQKVCDYMLKTFTLRRMEILKCKSKNDYGAFLLEWPRLVDTPGTLEHDFSQSYPLVADNLSSRWETVSAKIVEYFGSMKKTLLPFGIRQYSVLLRSKVKKITQADSVKTFIRVIPVLEDIDLIASNLPETTTLIKEGNEWSHYTNGIVPSWYILRETMRNSVLLFSLLAVTLAVTIHAAPPSRSPNPQVNLLRQGLIEKLCKKDLANGVSGAPSTSSTTTSTSSTTVKPTTKSRGAYRRSRQAAEGPSCSKYNNYTFAQLIEENKKLLRPVANRPN